MPHLSPMNWILAMLSIWSLLMCISSLVWWSPSFMWPSLQTSSTSSKLSSWSWYNL